jgi:hypothetical protein
MKNISRIVEAIVALSLGTAMITSCTSKNKNNEIITESATEQIEMTTTETATDEEMTTKETTTREEIPTRFPKEKKPDMPTIEEQVLVDNDIVKIIAKEFIVYYRYGASVKINVENKSEKDFDLFCRDVIVNDYICFSGSELSLNAGEKSDFEIEFRPESYYDGKSSQIGEIKLKFSLCETDSYYDVIQESDWIAINTFDIEAVEDKIDIDGITLFDQEGIKIVATENDGFDLESTTICAYVENNTDNDIYIDSKDLYVNGYMVDGSITYNNIYAHSKRKIYIDFYYYDNPDKEKIGIIDDLGVSFEIKDNNDRDITLMDTELVNFSAKELRYYDDCLRYCIS